MPGTRSILARNCGTAKLCRTSSGAQLQLDRPVQGQMQFLARDQQVVLAVGIVRNDAERIPVADALGFDGAQLAVLPGKAIAPVPLLAHHLDHRSVFRDGRRNSPIRTSRAPAWRRRPRWSPR